ncbi:MAG: Ig-like domain-containing protein, partial [Elusimicrobiota bacterium]
NHRNWIARRDGEEKVPFLRLLSGAVIDSYGNRNIEYSTAVFNKSLNADYIKWYPDEGSPHIEDAVYEIVEGDIKLEIKFSQYMDLLNFDDLSCLVIQDSTGPASSSMNLGENEDIYILTPDKDSKSVEFYIPYGFHDTVWQWQDGTLFLSIPEEKTGALKDLSGNEIEAVPPENAFKIWTDTAAMETPRVIGYSPADGSFNISRSTYVKVVFNEFLLENEAEKSLELFKLEDSTGKEVYEEIRHSTLNYDRQHRILIFEPESPLPGNSLIEARISKDSIFNLFGDSMGEDFVWRFRTCLERGKPNVIKSPSGMISVEVPEDQFPSSGRVDFTEGIPSENPQKSSLESYYSALKKEESWDNPYKYPLEELTFEILFSTDGKNFKEQVAFTQNARISIDYSSLVETEKKPGKSRTWDYVRSKSGGEGFYPPVSEETLRIYYLDEEDYKWRPLASSVDSGKKAISAPMRGFSLYTVMGGRSYATEDSYAYPVPYKPSEIPPEFQGDPSRSSITFANLPSECKIEIYTPSGRLVNSFKHSDNDLQEGAQAGNTYWYPVENLKGRPLASGVYIYLIESKGNRKSGKIMVIR